MTAESAWDLIRILIAWAVLLQTLELISVRAVFSDQGVWRWEILKPELPFLAWILKPRAFTVLLGLRCAAAIALPFSTHSLAPIFLALSSILICIRWRGTYNGGSDYMTLVILLALSAASLGRNHPRVISVALGYIAVQSVLSYFIAGVVKIRNPAWRSGQALSMFLNSPVYELPTSTRRISGHAAICLAGSWLLLGFECGFPIVFLGPSFCWGMLALALLFHLATVYALGLNRFLWAWIASYPAIIYVVR